MLFKGQSIEDYTSVASDALSSKFSNGRLQTCESAAVCSPSTTRLKACVLTFPLCHMKSVCLKWTPLNWPSDTSASWESWYYYNSMCEILKVDEK